ncbi:hypothetical protein [Lentilactobacillus hilgardii]|uniref:hypothetical protein n=1 Tax=Lentilactobacillus hilgardii TaxID=1588 RepID=UPI003FA552C0
MTHFDKQFKRLFLAIAALILFIPLFGSSVANSLFSDGQGMASAAKKSDKFDVNKVVKATVVYSKHVPILKVTVKPTITNAFAKKDQLKFEFDKKNVDLKNMQASVEKNLPFKHTTKKDTALLLTFEKDVKSGTYKQAYAIPTKKLSKVTKIKATYNGQKIKITNNKIKSGKYAQKQADTASKKDQSDFKNKSTSTANKSRDSQSADNNSSNHTTSARENSYPVKTGAVSDTQSAVAPQVRGQYSNDRSATSTSQEAYGHTTTISHYGDATANTSNNYASNGSQKTNWTATTSQTNNKDYGRGTGSSSANVTYRPVSYNSGVNRSGNGVSNKNTSRHNDKKAARSNSQKSSKSTVKTKKTETGKKTTSDKTKTSDSKKTTNKDSNDNQKTPNKNNKSDSTVDKAGDSSQKNDDGASNNASQSSNTNSNADSNDQTTPTSPTTDNSQTPAVGEDNTNSQESSTVDSSGNTDNTQNGSQTTSDSHSATTTNTNATSTSSDDGSSQTQASSTTNDQQSTQDQSATQTMTASTTGTATAGSNSVSTAVAA